MICSACLLLLYGPLSAFLTPKLKHLLTCYHDVFRREATDFGSTDKLSINSTPMMQQQWMLHYTINCSWTRRSCGSLHRRQGPRQGSKPFTHSHVHTLIILSGQWSTGTEATTPTWVQQASGALSLLHTPTLTDPPTPAASHTVS